MVLNLEFLVGQLEIFPYKICSIIYDNLARDTVPTNDVFPYEPYSILHCDFE